MGRSGRHFGSPDSGTRYGYSTTILDMAATERMLSGRNLALELVRTTEAAALAASRFVGAGDKIAADQAAVDAMRDVMSDVDMNGIVVIGEGEKDEAPMLYNGELVGTGNGLETDIAVDPIDGTTLTAMGRAGAIAVIAVADRGTMLDPGPCVYMDKIAVGPEAVGVVDIRLPIGRNLQALAKVKGKKISDLTAVVLARPRHDELVAEIREAGARIMMITDGDVAGAIATCLPESGADIMFGVGGTPEGIIAACAMKAMGGDLQGRLIARNAEEREAADEQGYDLEKILGLDDLVSSNNCFFAATGITSGDLLKGVTYESGVAQTHSLVMRSSSGTVRRIDAYHRLDKLSAMNISMRDNSGF